MALTYYFVCVMMLYFPCVAAIKCYSCNSHFVPDCGEGESHLNESYSIECDANATLCRKIEQWVDFEQGGLGPDFRIIRQCGHNQTNERSCYFREGLGGRVNVCTCYTDDCNSAPHLNFSKVLYFIALYLSIPVIKKIIL